jgi:deazaflavin-dependent oxidoreductase (nitroreductase family)
MSYTGARPPKDWTANLRETSSDSPAVDLDPIEQRAIDAAIPFAAEHARRYIATAGKDDGWQGPRPILLLYTTGRRSGDIRRNPLLYLELDGERYVIGSKGGHAAHPLWFRNLEAEPRVHVRVERDFYAATAEIVTGAARAHVWSVLVEGYPTFVDYQSRAPREIPVVRLRRTAS